MFLPPDASAQSQSPPVSTGSSMQMPFDANANAPSPPSPILEKCICELCECGDHRCPYAGSLGLASTLLGHPADQQHHPAHGHFGTSEYGRSFGPKPIVLTIPPSNGHRHQQQQHSHIHHYARSLPPAQPMLLESTHQHDYRPWYISSSSAPPFQKDKMIEHLMRRPLEPFTALTTQQHDFGPKPIPEENLMPQKRPHPMAPSSAATTTLKVPFLCESIHHSDYGPKPLDPLPPRPPFRPWEGDHHQLGGGPPMEAETTHSHDYRPFKGALEPAKPFGPPSERDNGKGQKKAKFQDETEHGANYGPKSLLVPPSPIRGPTSQNTAEWRRTPMPREVNKSEYQEEFSQMPIVLNIQPKVPHPNDQRQMANVAGGIGTKGHPFNAKSTTQIDFGPKAMPRQRLCLAERVITRRDHSYTFAGVRDGHRYYQHCQLPPRHGIPLPPVHG